MRTHQGMILTKAGQSFLTDSELLLNYYQNAIAKAKNIENRPHKKIVRLGTSLIAPASYLASFLNEKIKEEFIFDIIPLTTTMATADLVFENLGKYVDLMVDIYDQSLLDRYGCAAKKICDLPCQIACLPGNVLLKKQNLKLGDLQGQVVNFYYPTENEISHKWQATLAKAG